MDLSKFDKHIQWNIKSFLGANINWKHIFTTQVIPNLDKGWKWVAKDDNGICLNCYYYGNGIDKNCAQGIGRQYDNHKFNYLMSYSEFQQNSPGSRFKVFKHFTDFKKFRNVSLNSFHTNFSYAIIHRIVPLIE